MTWRRGCTAISTAPASNHVGFRSAGRHQWILLVRPPRLVGTSEGSRTDSAQARLPSLRSRQQIRRREMFPSLEPARVGAPRRMRVAGPNGATVRVPTSESPLSYLAYTLPARAQKATPNGRAQSVAGCVRVIGLHYAPAQDGDC